MLTDVLVIGAGLAGLIAGWQAAKVGLKTRVIAKGWGITHWHSGCIDVLGYYPSETGRPVVSPEQSITALISANPDHPYARIGLDGLAQALKAIQALCTASNYPLHGSLDRNWLLPSAAGAARPTCLAPETMVAGDLGSREPMALVGLAGFHDFYPGLAADNLNRQGVLARPITLNLASLQSRQIITGVGLARLFDTVEFRTEVVTALKPRLGQAARIGFPAVLGLRQPLANLRDLETRLERPVFEIPCLPPSVAGMRLHQILVTAIQQAGGNVFEGMPVVGVETEGRRVTGIWSQAAARRLAHRAAVFILATGGILGGGFNIDEAGRMREEIFDLPLIGPTGFQPTFVGAGGHPIYRAGVEVTANWLPVDNRKQVVYDNVLVIGANLAHFDGLRERSLEGVTLGTGYLAGRQAAAPGQAKMEV